MHKGLARRQVEEELRQLRSRIACLTRNEAKLRDTQEAYHLLVDRSLQGLMILQDQRIVFANQAAADITGRGMEELLTTPLEQAIAFVHPDDRAMLRQRHTDRLQGLPVPARYEFRALYADGSLHWLEIHAGVIEYRGRSAIQVTLTDITPLKQTQLALRKSEEQFRAVFAQAPAMVGIIDTEGRWTYMNQHMADALGYSGTELAHLRVSDITDPRDRELTLALIARLLHGEIDHFRVEKRYVRKDGGVLWADLSVSPIYGEHGRIEALIGAGMDITDRKRSEILTEIQRDLAVNLGPLDDLREGLHLCLHAAIRASGLDCGGIYLRDEASGSMDLLCHTGLSEDFARRVSHYDRHAVNVRLTMAGEPIYANYAKLTLPPDGSEAREALQAIAIVPIVHRKQIIGCLNVASHSVAEVPPHSRMALETIAGQINGTIARLKAERALRESEQRFRTLFEAAPDLIYVTDLEGTLVNANRTAEQLSGIPRDQAIGTNLLALGLFSEGQTPRMVAHLKASAEGKATGPEEFTIHRRDGVCLTLEARTFPITIDNRTLVLGIARDITERKRAERQTREHHEQLLHISRLSTLGEMASGFAHELNQPLSAILCYATASRRLLEQQTLNVDLMRRDLDQIVAQAKRAGEIVKRVRAFVQRRPPLLRPTDTNDIIREVLAFLHFDVIHKEIQVVLDLDRSLPRVLADAIQLEQALLNLVRNAIEAMEATEPRQRRLTIRTTAPDADTVKVTISDTGPGLPPEIRDRIFDPFVTTKLNGLGIGLSITRTIVELHRGQLWVEPGPGPGCTFAFTLAKAWEDSKA